MASISTFLRCLQLAPRIPYRLVSLPISKSEWAGWNWNSSNLFSYYFNRSNFWNLCHFQTWKLFPEAVKILTSKLKLFILVFLFFLFIVPSSVAAQENGQTSPKESRVEAVVTKIQEEKEVKSEGVDKKTLYQKLDVLVTSENRKGEKLEVENNIPVVNAQRYKVGDRIVISVNQTPNGKEMLYITDYVRRAPLYWLFAIFAALTVLIGRKRGIASLIGMGLSFFVIFTFVLPQILSGKDPIFIAITASLFIIPISFYLAHGLNRKTTAAVIGTLIALVITGILANLFVDAAKLTGFASEEAAFLQQAKPDLINIRGLLLAGIIIGVLGILDDITISQAAIVAQLKQTSPKIPFWELFQRSMDIGRDHIASMVNTLILVYTGAALPLLLLFTNNPQPFSELINYEIVSEEIVRTLVASIGLILAVPITTFITTVLFDKKIG